MIFINFTLTLVKTKMSEQYKSMLKSDKSPKVSQRNLGDLFQYNIAAGARVRDRVRQERDQI